MRLFQRISGVWYASVLWRTAALNRQRGLQLAASVELLINGRHAFLPPATGNSRSQYSATGGRCLSAMVSRQTLNRTGRRMIVKPFVVFAARCLGPGPLRLQMVKLAHEMGEGQNFFEVFYGRQRSGPKPALEAPQAHSSRRAA